MSGADSGSTGDEIDGAGDPGLEAVGRETRDGMNAGLARGEPLPVVGLAGAERGDEAAAGDDDDRPSGLIAHGCHTNLPGPFAAPALHGPENRRLCGRVHAQINGS